MDAENTDRDAEVDALETELMPTVADEGPDQEDTLGTDVLSSDGSVDTEDLPPAMAVNTPTGSHAGSEGPLAHVGHVLADRYRLEQQLAERGGTATWRAFDQKLSRSVLVHLLGADDPRTSDALDAARKAATATDARFLRVLDAVEPVGDEPAVVVCEFAPGESMEKLLRQGPLSALEAAWVARELADAMSSVHAEGLFHQRINPDTVIITATGAVKVVGFLIEAALHPDADQGILAWSEREEADVRAIGKVLYASLVNRWPTEPGQLHEADQARPWGMPPAPVDQRGWLTPRQVRSGVSPALDTICDQVLSASPRQNELPLRTANQLVGALNKVLGTADASADLERRMRFPVHAADAYESGDDTGRMAPLEHTFPGVAFAGATAAATEHPIVVPAPAPRTTSPHTPTDAPTVVRGATIMRPRPRPTKRPWLAALVGLVLLVLVASLLRLAWQKATGDGTGSILGENEVQTYTPTNVDDFDPTADNGNGEENPNLVKYAWDGNPATAWQTLVYLNSAKFGKLKPGVGLVVDLGQQASVGEVNVRLKGTPTGIQLRVPNDTGATSAPTTKASAWKTVASIDAAGTTAQLKPASPVTTRYLLVYVTSLPNIGSNKYQASINEIEVKS